MEETDFGFKKVRDSEKESLVQDIFNRVANRYDVMNDVMSLTLHRLWKKDFVARIPLFPGINILDVASGTGDIGRMLYHRITDAHMAGRITMTDLNQSMLDINKNKCLDEGILQNIEWVQSNAESLPFHDNHFDICTIAFGLRNVTHKSDALAQMCRVLRPGGRLYCMEFGQPSSPLIKQVYDAYSFGLIPRLGQWIAHDKEAYDYLVESIRTFPEKETVLTMFKDAGFDSSYVDTLCGGIVSIFIATKEGRSL